jgi:type IX secretion system PorP/SprF family membrane protein
MKRLIILIILVTVNLVAWGQDPQFSQFYSSPLHMGPSFAGAAEQTRINLNYRDQWPKLPGVFVTYSFAADHYIREMKSGFGVYLMNDQAGDGKINTTNVAANYSYKIKLSEKWNFRPGIKFFYHQYQIDYNKVVFNDQLGFDYINPTSVEIPEDNRFSYFDFGSSLLFYNSRYWIGTMVDHMIKASPSFDDNPNYKPLKYSVFGGAQIPLESLHYKRKLHSLYATFHFKNQQAVSQLDVGAYYEKDHFLVGLWYRGLPMISQNYGSDAIILMMGYKGDGFSVGYSYDATISRLITHTGGAHEISLSYSFSGGDILNTHEYSPLPCPEL